MIKLDIPFIKQVDETTCGPMALKRVLTYFGRDQPLEALEEKTGIKKGKGVYTIQLAIAAASLGNRTDFYSKHILFNEEHMKHEFFRKYADLEIDMDASRKLVEKAKAAGVKVQERTLTLGELLSLITNDSIPIVLLDWNIIKSQRERGYQGHFVPILGYDEESIYIHDDGESSGKIIVISRTIFDEARKADGTDEDIVLVYRSQGFPKTL